MDKVEKVDNWFPEIGELPNAKHDNRELLRIGATIYEVLALFRHKKCSTYPRIRVLESDLYVTINSHSVHYRHGADKYHLHI